MSKLTSNTMFNHFKFQSNDFEVSCIKLREKQKCGCRNWFEGLFNPNDADPKFAANIHAL